MNFVKKVFEGEVDEEVHSKFVRFGKGYYKGRFLLSLWRTNKVKVKSSFEFANDFVLLVSDLGDFSFNGIILSKNKIENLNGQKKSGAWVYDVKNIGSDEVKKLADRVYFFLLNVNSDEIKLKIKAKLPKPGKDEDKIDDKFCQLEVDPKFYSEIKNDFFWDLTEGKKISVKHEVVIDEIMVPKGEKDFAKVRELAKRKGKLIRNAVIDGKEVRKEVEFEA